MKTFAFIDGIGPDPDTGATAAPNNQGQLATVYTPDEIDTLIAQPRNRHVSISSAFLAGDIGNVVSVSAAGACDLSLGDLSASLDVGGTILLTVQCEGASTALTVTPGAGVTIDGSAGVYTADVGRARVSLISRDGLAFYSGTP